jgi:hypothetical protein
VPLFIDRKIPPDVPAKIVAPFTTKEKTLVSARPVLTADHVVPESADKKTPLPKDPAKTFVPLTSNAGTKENAQQVTGVQLLPLFVERQMPILFPTKILESIIANENTPVLHKFVLTYVHWAFEWRGKEQS